MAKADTHNPVISLAALLRDELAEERRFNRELTKELMERGVGIDLQIDQLKSFHESFHKLQKLFEGGRKVPEVPPWSKTPAGQEVIRSLAPILAHGIYRLTVAWIRWWQGLAQPRGAQPKTIAGAGWTFTKPAIQLAQRPRPEEPQFSASMAISPSMLDSHVCDVHKKASRTSGRQKSDEITAAHQDWKGSEGVPPLRRDALFRKHIPQWETMKRSQRAAARVRLMDRIYKREKREKNNRTDGHRRITTETIARG